MLLTPIFHCFWPYKSLEGPFIRENTVYIDRRGEESTVPRDTIDGDHSETGNDGPFPLSRDHLLPRTWQRGHAVFRLKMKKEGLRFIHSFIMEKGTNVYCIIGNLYCRKRLKSTVTLFILLYKKNTSRSNMHGIASLKLIFTVHS
jgi:hypothetical protein